MLLANTFNFIFSNSLTYDYKELCELLSLIKLSTHTGSIKIVDFLRQVWFEVSQLCIFTRSLHKHVHEIYELVFKMRYRLRQYHPIQLPLGPLKLNLVHLQNSNIYWLIDLQWVDVHM